ncbi:Uncharacterised protein [Candidatus Anstonella stagnisolia]|nr:Uncharacterised protein [Candidatus Anstonella stagnisolia]
MNFDKKICSRCNKRYTNRKDGLCQPCADVKDLTGIG